MKYIPLTCAAVVLMTACGQKQEVLKYPQAPADSTVVDTYFDMEVADPFRPLENDTSAQTAKWVEEENAVTRAYLDKIPYRKAILNRLTALNNYRKKGIPSKHTDGYYYFYENNGLQNQSVLYRTRDLDSDSVEVFLDPNKLSEDGTVALTGISMSNDDKYTAYTISRSGSDWTEIYVMDTKTGELLPDHIEWAKFTGAQWKGDGFYYSAYPRPEQGKEFSNANENHRIYYHKLGTPQSADVVAYEDAEHPLHFHSAQVPEDESALFVYGSGEGLGNSVAVKMLNKANSPWTVIEPSQDYEISVLDVIDRQVYFYTNYGAPRYRVMTAPLAAPQRKNWKEIVPEAEGVLVGVDFVGKDKMILTYETDAYNQAYLHKIDGSLISKIELPSIGSVGFSSSRKHDEVYYKLTSFINPGSVYSLNPETGESKVERTVGLEGFNPDDYVTEQVFYTSADSTKVPMFITYKKGLERNGKNPVYLYGYGGFNISLTPGFSANRLLWLENGGIYAQANLLGVR